MKSKINAEQASRHARFAQYQAQTTPAIPVVALTLVESGPLDSRSPSKPVSNGG